MCAVRLRLPSGQTALLSRSRLIKKLRQHPDLLDHLLTNVERAVSWPPQNHDDRQSVFAAVVPRLQQSLDRATWVNYDQYKYDSFLCKSADYLCPDGLIISVHFESAGNRIATMFMPGHTSGWLGMAAVRSQYYAQDEEYKGRTIWVLPSPHWTVRSKHSIWKRNIRFHDPKLCGFRYDAALSDYFKRPIRVWNVRNIGRL